MVDKKRKPSANEQMAYIGIWPTRGFMKMMHMLNDLEVADRYGVLSNMLIALQDVDWKYE